MKKQAIEQTQFNEVRNRVSEYARSNTVKERIETFEPSSNLDEVLLFQKETGEGVSLVESQKSIPSMASEKIDRLFQKIEDGYVLGVKELLEISGFLRTIRKIKRYFQENKKSAPTLYEYSVALQSFRHIEEAINISIKNNLVTSEASRELKKTRQNIIRYDSNIRDKMHKFINSSTNKFKIQEFMVIERDGVLTVPVKSAFKNSIKGRIVAESGKGSTAFLQPEATIELSRKLQMFQAEESTIVYQILANLTEEVAVELKKLKETNEIVLSLEMIIAKSKYSVEINGRRVNINDQGRINLIEAKHPLLDNVAVPLSIQIGALERGLVITGSNSGGKTVVLKTIGLLTFMTMMGLFIPADTTSEISIFEHILVDIGDYQDFDNALSTFSGHINNMRAILEVANNRSLVLVDEIGSGTDPSEGAAIAIAILETLTEKGALVLATTHYGEIKEFAVKDELFLTAAMAFDRETLQPLYRLLMNEVGESNGLFIAHKMKLDESVINRAAKHLELFKTL